MLNNNKYSILTIKEFTKKMSLYVLIFFCSCSTKPTIKLINTVKIDEDSMVIHHLASINIINDSICGLSVSPISYCLYNYKDGKMVKRLNIDSFILNKTLSMVRNNGHPDYQKINADKAKAMGVTPYEIENIYTESNKSIKYIFFNSMFVAYGTTIYQGEKTNLVEYKRMPYIAECDSNFNIQSIYNINNKNENYTNELLGVGSRNHQFYAHCFNLSNKYLITILNKINDSTFDASKSIIPTDSLSRILWAEHHLQCVNFYNKDSSYFTICSGFGFYDANGKLLYNYNSHNPDEQIMSCRRTKNNILFYSFIWKQNDKQKDVRRIYRYNFPSHTLTMLCQFDNDMTGNFNNNNEFIGVVDSGQHYYFKTYQLYDQE